MGRDYVHPVGEYDVILFPGTVEKGIDLELILGPGKVCEKLVAYVEALILYGVSDRMAALPAVHIYWTYGLDVFHQAWLIVVGDIIKVVETLLPKMRNVLLEKRYAQSQYLSSYFSL